jgi:predicted amidohydrolase YtcJ
LEVGKRADFVITNRDWLKLSDPHEVLNAQILQTFIDGEQVHPPATLD